MATKVRKPKPGDPDYRHPYVEFEALPIWALVEKGIRDLVQNQDLTELEDRNYIVGYLCKVITKGQHRTKA
jgi:hypothetical protein